MYICDICENTFEEPIRKGCCTERLGIEVEEYCPCCGSNAVSEAIICKGCEKAFNENEVTFIDVTNSYNQNLQNYICNDCLYEALEEILGDD